MAALAAYLVALCLLLTGGYGALNWLASPDAVTVAAKAKASLNRSPSPKAEMAPIVKTSSPPSDSSPAAEPSANDDPQSTRATPPSESANTAALLQVTSLPS